MAKVKDGDNKSLELVFRTKFGRTKTIIIYDQKDDATNDECIEVAQYFLDNNILLLSHAEDELTELAEARFHTCQYAELL
ncbi:DUF2922 domain-containing protein [uncultured Phascolarctobacterium sp.]|uniref:DUF2922 domain-containing protein n=1 Tax=uncultured Phascolarctobacterium sp. TaxID=512296 RepID=UPI0025EBD7C9|nr:DUF2922 domain-containing protein [uncultured Phascolarctobacterium sp.]